MVQALCNGKSNGSGNGIGQRLAGKSERVRVVSVIYWESCCLLVVQCHSYTALHWQSFSGEPELGTC